MTNGYDERMEGVGSPCSGFMSLHWASGPIHWHSPPGNISRPSGLGFVFFLTGYLYKVKPIFCRHLPTSVIRRTQSTLTLNPQLELNFICKPAASSFAKLSPPELILTPPSITNMDLDLHDPDNDALTRFPIPALDEDLSNYYAWQHAVYFHLRYHGVFYFITGHEQSRWELRWQDLHMDENMNDQNAQPPTKHDRKNYQRRNMHAYSIVFSKIGNIVPRLLEAGWDGDRDSFGFRTDLLWNRIQELRRMQHEQQDRAASHLGNHSSRAISLTDDE